MRGLYRRAAVVSMVAACIGNTDSTKRGSGVVDGGPPPVLDGCAPDGAPTPDGSEACPIETASFTRPMGLSDERQVLDLAVDTAGNVVLAAGPALRAELVGVVGLTPAGELRFARPFGSVIAADDSGNVWIAGAFDQPLDIGLGVMEPCGESDVFVARLDMEGQVTFARALGLPGEGLHGIAVDPDGRIAVSGSALGTVVMSSTGEVELERPYSGAIAFDQAGNLVIAGSFETIDLGDGPVTAIAPGTDVFVIALAPSGCRLFSHIMAGNGGRSVATAVAIGPDGEIVLVGYTTRSLDLLGTIVTAIEAGENGRVTGAFAAKIDAAGAPIWVLDLGIVEANDVAVDATGRVIVNGALTGGAGFLRRVAIQAFDARGNRLTSLEEYLASGYGRGLGVDVDVCGSVYAASIALDTPSRNSPLRSYVTKLAL